MVAAVISLPPAALPEWPPGWYVVARARDLPPGAVRELTLAGNDIVLFRTASGALGALDAYCPHMGAHLGRGRVQGEQLECALHCWRIFCDGAIGEQHKRARSWTVREQYGQVLIDLGGGRPIPEAGDAQFDWTHARPLDVAAAWHGLVANAFDMPHLCSVHHRELVSAPEVSVVPGRSFSIHYRSSVRGRALSDRLMKWLSRDRIDVIVRCFGNVTTVETDLGFTRTAACIGMTPTPQGTRMYAAFGVRRGPLRALRLALARWLFTEFLRRDLGVVEGMRLNTEVDDPVLVRLFEFLRGLRR